MHENKVKSNSADIINNVKNNFFMLKYMFDKVILERENDVSYFN